MSPAVKMEKPICEASRRREFHDDNDIAETCKKRLKYDLTYSKCKSFLDNCTSLQYSSTDSTIHIKDAKRSCHLIKQYLKSQFKPLNNSENFKEGRSVVPNGVGNESGETDCLGLHPPNYLLSVNNKKYEIDCDKPNPRTIENLVRDCNFKYTMKDSVMQIHDGKAFMKIFSQSILPADVQDKCQFQKELVAFKRNHDTLHSTVRNLTDELQKCQAFIISGQSKWKINPSLLSENSEVPVLNGLTSPNSKLLPTVSQAKAEEGVELLGQKTNKNAQCPPDGPLEKKPLGVNCKVYAMRFNLLRAWQKAVIIKEEESEGETRFKVKFERHSITKWCTKKMIAYEQPPNVRLTFLRRVLALFTPEDKSARPAMYAGVVGEIPKGLNQFRYLIFFDDGIAQYVAPENVRVIYEESKNIWEDIDPQSREFVKKIHDDYPEKVMLRVKKGQLIKSEYNGKWLYAKVMTVDGSMVKLLFENERRYEWLYRGSTRLEALYKELENAKQNQKTGRVRRLATPGRNKDNQPYVEYRQNQDAEIDEIVIDSDSDSDLKKEETPSESEPVKRNVAKKSTSQLKKIIPLKKSNISNFKEGKIETLIEDHLYTPLKFRRHPYNVCTRLCLRENCLDKYKGENPLCLPLRFGFQRQNGPFRRRGAQKNNIYYRAPCGRMLRNKDDILRFLFSTDCELTIDMFSMDPDVIPNRFFTVSKQETLFSIADITEGIEKMKIPCVNCLTNEPPVYVKYSNEPYEGRGVEMNTDKGFLCGCDCTDNCEDASKCVCQQLTISIATKKGEEPAKVGYKYRRLTESVLTAIYECNSQCHCKKSCVNRVVQNGIQCRLQMFKTEKKGWGVRCLDDLEAGTFITIYAGQIQTDQAADEDGKRLGDEYLADLDHIEVAEGNKEGYEAEAYDSEPESPVAKKEESDEDDMSSKSSTSSDSPGMMDYSDSDYELAPEDEPDSILGTIYTTRSKTKKSDNTSDHKGIQSKKYEVGIDTLTIVRPVSPETQARFSLVQNPEPNFGTKHTGGAKKSSGSQHLPPPSHLKRTGAFRIRSYFKERDPYIMDAKVKGNIGRYLNHSCNPNSFVQNVFLETHDLRFPTVAFFTGRHITAGTELTWDYSYEIGSVKGKKLLCYCGTSNCRGRLL